MGSALIYEFSPPDLRANGNTVLSIIFASCKIIAVIWGFVDNNTWVWKIAFFSQIIPSLTVFI